ncbi:unnamed protein product [Alopecurus aequalis]
MSDLSPLTASGSTSAAGSVPLRRGLISCLHSSSCRADDDAPLLSDEDLPPAIDKLIVSFYDEAFNRLPCDAMPELLRHLTTGGGGSCLGLLDPVSNTLALLPKDDAPAAEASTSPPAKRRSKRLARNTRSIPGPGGWRQVASRSYHSLLAFLMAYFGCLEKEQAIRYLYRADANLLLAAMLIQHDLYAEEEALDPESDRTQAALEWAATIAGHPSPTTLARLMSIRLKDHDFGLLKKLFSAADVDGIPLTVEDVRATHRIVHMMMSPICTASVTHTKRGLVVVHVRHIPEATCSETTTVSTTADARTTSTALRWGGGTTISLVQFGVLPDKLQDCLRIADGQKHNLKSPCGGHACDYLQSLKMYLHGTIHNLYIKALKLLPTPSGSLMRSILKAGYCYGCLDPVSNIIVNSTWYDSCGCNLPVSERMEMAEYNDILDPLYLFRTEIHSLKGLIELAAFTDPQFSVPASALELLCSTKCDIANVLTSWTERSSEKNPFHEAAVAAGHPHPLGLGELHQQLLLMPDARSVLLSFIAEAQTSGTVLRVDDMIRRISVMWNRNRSEAQTVQAPELCARALRAVSSKRSEYEDRRSWFRSKIEKLLKEYTTQQLSEPEYKLDTILGVEDRNKGSPPFGTTFYHVNFTATCDLQLHRTLFFAEFSYAPWPEFCCPLPYACVGRCYYGVHSARKIVYPDDAKYIPDDITLRGTRSVDRMLEMDLVYFSPELDVEIAKNLNMLPSEEEEEKNKKKRRRGRGLCPN